MVSIEQRYVDPTTNIILDTLKREKQALVFVSSKRSAEKVASDMAKKLKTVTQADLATQILAVLSQPTEQCRRLSEAVEKGVAFHHAGLASRQRELIEDAFRDGRIKIISCTPTLAAGVDLPAFRTVIRDLKRYTGSWGMQYIPVLEYQQMAGRAGRPGKEEYGEAICIASNEADKETILYTFLNADVEPIYSKLAVEPVLRTYVLSLTASGFIKSMDQALGFFEKTFWARQYGDMHKLQSIIRRVVKMLQGYGFLETEGLQATVLGERVAQLYLDPLTADHIMRNLAKQPTQAFGYLQMLSHTLEMRPLLRLRRNEREAIEDELSEAELLMDEPSLFDEDYQMFFESMKTALCFRDWIDEAGEDLLLQRYAVRPGELRAKQAVLDWLLYCAGELAKISGRNQHLGMLAKLRTRCKYGVKEELLPLLRFRGIGRVRARKLFGAGIKNSGDIRKVSPERLVSLLGTVTAGKLKEQADAAFPSFRKL